MVFRAKSFPSCFVLKQIPGLKLRCLQVPSNCLFHCFGPFAQNYSTCSCPARIRPKWFCMLVSCNWLCEDRLSSPPAYAVWIVGSCCLNFRRPACFQLDNNISSQVISRCSSAATHNSGNSQLFWLGLITESCFPLHVRLRVRDTLCDLRLHISNSATS